MIGFDLLNVLSDDKWSTVPLLRRTVQHIQQTAAHTLSLQAALMATAGLREPCLQYSYSWFHCWFVSQVRDNAQLQLLLSFQAHTMLCCCCYCHMLEHADARLALTRNPLCSLQHVRIPSLHATVSTAVSAAQLSVTLQHVSAVRAEQYSWSASIAAHPSGLSIKMGHSSSMTISTNVTRTHLGTRTVVSGWVQLLNSADTPLLLSHVQVTLQQQGPSGLVILPQRVFADCPRAITSSRRSVDITLQAGAALRCPFAAVLADVSHAALTAHAQAHVQGTGQLVSSFPVKAWLSLPLENDITALSSSSGGDGVGGGGGQQGVVSLGRCAVATDTFASGGLYLAPTAVAAGVKLPPLGAGSAVCERSVTSKYRVTFGPFKSSTTACGTYKVRRLGLCLSLPYCVSQAAAGIHTDRHIAPLFHFAPCCAVLTCPMPCPVLPCCAVLCR